VSHLVLTGMLLFPFSVRFSRQLPRVQAVRDGRPLDAFDLAADLRRLRERVRRDEKPQQNHEGSQRR
jgi:hypothetical protein